MSLWGDQINFKIIKILTLKMETLCDDGQIYNLILSTEDMNNVEISMYSVNKEQREIVLKLEK